MIDSLFLGGTVATFGSVLPSNQALYLPSFLFAAVIVVLLLRPDGLFTRAGGTVERV